MREGVGEEAKGGRKENMQTRKTIERTDISVEYREKEKDLA